jgi:ATP-dependent helicase/nuclease subunit B
MKHRDTSNVIDWAKRINRGWFVRNGLADAAAAWLAHLEETDPARLLGSCDIARALSRGPDRVNDPKPWFYGGLFSLATEAEARKFLANYRLTSAIIPALATDPEANQWVAGLKPATQELIARLRTAVQAEVAKRSAGPGENPPGALPTRVFLGWDRPFLGLAVEWLLARREQLPGMLVVVPTAESARRLREALAEAAGGLLSPRFATPGSFMKIETQIPDIAPDWVEQVAWVEALEEVTDWSAYEALFPEAPAVGGDWAGAIGREMVRLRRTLQENGLTLATAARRLAGTVEAERWEALGRLEALVERKLAGWSYRSRSQVLAAGLPRAPGGSTLVLAGVTELPPVVARAWAEAAAAVTVLIAAPAAAADTFSALGCPLDAWRERDLPWPDGAAGSVRVVADPRQQAAEAVRLISEEGADSAAVAVGAADPEVGAELARALTREGWPAFHPAAAALTHGLRGWFKAWANWQEDATLAALADLLTLPQTAGLVAGGRAWLARSLAEVRGRWMVIRTADLERRLSAAQFRNEDEQAAAEAVMAAARTLEEWRQRLLRGDFAETLLALLDSLATPDPADAEMAAAMREWLAQAAPVIARVDRRPGFWLELMVAEVPAPGPQPPPGRVIDVQGWLELLFEPGRHLVLCGMNEGQVPARSGGEPWLGEAARSRLGLPGDALRAARDAFLYQAMVAARQAGGRVDVLCGKAGAGGETLLPSRLLLAAERTALPQRVATLFREVEPPEAGLRWQADWQWTPRQLGPPKRISVTSLRDYLACPFRYYLKHVVGMQDPETARLEWNARDFGIVAHTVLERWGLDVEAREFEKTEALSDWFSAELERVVAAWFGRQVPMAVRIQTESLRQRFAWLARVQGCERAAGWQVVDVERKVELPVGDAVIVAKIDRIDRHRDTGELRVIDYKTGRVKGVADEHRRKIIATTVLPAHLGTASPAVYQGADTGKPATFRWTNLQLPLYAAAQVRLGNPMPQLCYLTLGATASDVGLHSWSDFSATDLAAAQACAEWIVGNIARGVFGPPADRVTYDDFEVLATGRPLAESMDCSAPFWHW